MSKNTKQQNEAIEVLTKILANSATTASGKTIVYARKAVSRSGMSAQIVMYVLSISAESRARGGHTASLENITEPAATICRSRYNLGSGTLTVSGCGFDRVLHTLDNVASRLSAQSSIRLTGNDFEIRYL